jgi:hypothetical protein
MPEEYQRLARARVAAQWPGYGQPEDFGYEFRDWVSPYTKTACALGGIGLVLQDWASADGLRNGPDPDVQEYGRIRTLRTNQVLEVLLGRMFGATLADVYATNAFPFIKCGPMSSALPFRDVLKAVRLFAAPELVLARPTMILAVGGVAHRALQRVGLPSILVPHPAARIGGVEVHALAWRRALGRL